MGRACSQYNRCTQKLLTFVFVLTAYSPAVEAKEILLDRIVAVVNGYPILHSEVIEKVQGGVLETISSYPAEESDSPYDKAMHDAINYRLILLEAEEKEIVVSDEDLEKEIDRFLSGRGLDRNGLKQFLAARNKTMEEYKKDFREQITISRFQGRIIRPLVKVTDKDLQTYYMKRSGSTAESVELVLRQIFIKVGSDASESVKKAKKEIAEDVYQKLESGFNFVEAAKIYSDAADARDNGGLMGSIKLSDLSEMIRPHVAELEKEQYSEPVETPLGYHIFYLDDKVFRGGMEFEKIKDRLEIELKTQELMRQLRRWIIETRQKSKIILIEE